jgi:hypothetical protein
MALLVQLLEVNQLKYIISRARHCHKWQKPQFLTNARNDLTVSFAVAYATCPSPAHFMHTHVHAVSAD